MKIPCKRPITQIVRNLRRSIVVRFSVISFAGMVALAVLLGFMLERRITERALQTAASTAHVLSEVTVNRYVGPAELRAGLEPVSIRRLDELLRGPALQAAGVKKAKVFDSNGRLIYANDGSHADPPAGVGPNVRKALAGQTVRSVSKGTDDQGRGELTLSAYMPIRDSADERPAGVFEVYLDYAPIEAAARRDVRAMWLVMAVLCGVVWFLLVRLVDRVARALRGQIDENRRQATHDALTGLPNRTLLFERVAEAVAAGPLALLQLDLDGFREINDTLSHEHGDDLLVEVANRLSACMEPGDIVARLGGDEFAVVRPGVDGEVAARELADTLVEALRTPIDVRGTTAVVDATVGIALAPLHGEDAPTLIRRAEVAMYQGKTRHGGVSVYDAAGDHHNRARLELLGELGGAIRRGELVLAYQPKLDLATGNVKGVEALVRWEHPQHGLLFPGAFVPAAEVTSLVRPLTLHVVDAALHAHRMWAEQGLDLPVAVNLAGPCVTDAGMPQAIADLLADHGVPASALTLEISEKTMMNDVAGAVEVLQELRTLGVRLSLDDFGTGQTSLGQLRHLPLDELKIDRSLVTGDERLLGSVVEIAHKFGLRAVGEGVETEELADALAATGCDEVQGFLYAKPMWADQVPGWVADRTLVATA